MLDKKISITIDILIKKLKDNKLGSIKLSNKNNTIEISNYSENQNSYQITQNTPSTGLQNKKNDMVLRQSQHGRSMCRRCKMVQDLSKATNTYSSMGQVQKMEKTNDLLQQLRIAESDR